MHPRGVFSHRRAVPIYKKGGKCGKIRAEFSSPYLQRQARSVSDDMGNAIRREGEKSCVVNENQAHPELGLARGWKSSAVSQHSVEIHMACSTVHTNTACWSHAFNIRKETGGLANTCSVLLATLRRSIVTDLRSLSYSQFYLTNTRLEKKTADSCGGETQHITVTLHQANKKIQKGLNQRETK